jgi:formylglycine-generating enzyme required for sulfatase activity
MVYAAEKYESYDGPIVIKDNLGADLAKTAINGFRLLKARKAMSLYTQQMPSYNGIDTNYVEGKDFTVIREVKELWLMPYLGEDKTYRIGLVARYKLVKGNPKSDEDLNLCRGCTDAQRKVITEIAAQMAPIPGGDFTMGCKARDNNCQADEKPVTLVSLNNFMIGRFEVTQRQYLTILGSNPSYNYNCADCPVEEVSWDDAQRFISKLNELSGKNYRLPTEAEWEFAAAGGKDFVYVGADVIKDVAWYAENSGNTTHPVGLNTPNSFGLYDMSGNVWEWCSDWYQPYKGTHQTNPQGPSTGSYRVIRGGSWNNSAKSCRVSTRFNNSQTNRFFNLGFRLAHAEQ